MLRSWINFLLLERLRRWGSYRWTFYMHCIKLYPHGSWCMAIMLMSRKSKNLFFRRLLVMRWLLQKLNLSMFSRSWQVCSTQCRQRSSLPWHCYHWFLASASLTLFPACTARAAQLESRVSTLESALAKQEEILVAAQEEMQEKILAADERSVIWS